MLDVKVTVDATEADRILDRLTASGFDESIAKYVADEVVLPRFMKYPGASGKAQPFVSAKQRKFFFAALRSGQISVPYRRSGALGSKWQQLPFAHGVLLRSQQGYSEIVIGERQGAYFKGTWQSIIEQAKAAEPDAALAATAFIVKTIAQP